MKICLIGSSGHWLIPLETLSAKGDDRIIGVAPGSIGEEMENVVHRCVKIGHNPKLFRDYRKMLDSLKPDVVSVACRLHDHARVAKQVLDHGCHLFIEKPVAITLSGLDLVKKAHAQSGKLLAAMLCLRYNPAILAAWQAVQSGAIGEVRLLTAQKSYKLGSRPDYYKSRKTYGGTIPWVGSHAIDLLAWFAEKPFQTVFATHSTRGNKKHGTMEATALCLFMFENEIVASANLDFLRPSTAPTHGDDRIRVAGTEGVIEVRENQAMLINDFSEKAQILDAPVKRYIFDDFLKQVRGEGKCLVTAHDSFTTTEACLLARSSADKGKLIRFHQVPRKPL